LKELAKRREIERIKIKNNNFKTNRNNGTGKHRTPLLPSNLPAAPSNTPIFIARIPNHPANFNPRQIFFYQKLTPPRGTPYALQTAASRT
jgi:hypothetical protein